MGTNQLALIHNLLIFNFYLIIQVQLIGCFYYITVTGHTIWFTVLTIKVTGNFSNTYCKVNNFYKLHGTLLFKIN